LIDIHQPMQIWLQASIAKTQITVKINNYEIQNGKAVHGKS
jgi:hypothetical protein